jgi:cytidylate kinase
MGLLMGFMIGAMRKVWPWKEVLREEEIGGKLRVLEEANILPEHFDTGVVTAVALALLGFLVVMALERVAGGDARIEAIGMDGPAGAGKSTVAKRVAEALDFLYVDTGAMYRAVTLAAMQTETDLEDDQAMGALARESEIRFDHTGTKVFLNGDDVSEAIRTPELTRNIKYAAGSTAVRTELVRQQQAIAKHRPVVMEGRDITTVVLPHARWPFYLDASVDCRAERRMKDLEAKGEAMAMEELKRDIEARDRSDAEREVGPLQRTDAQIYLDTSAMTQEEVVDWIVKRVRKDRGAV